ncbi:hypothetical protein [Sulfurospirillum cavolei]|uniref:hypothetical protein n=1 Tax=Sulfurospirillum cavolei TaxID=366522 RepID=UPI0007649AF7|nr:hypothetical protein [Sulfurospirillum cavolei]
MIINSMIVLVLAYAALGYFGYFDKIPIVLQIILGGVLLWIVSIVSQAIDISNAKARRNELSKKIPLFNTSDIGRNYIALGMVEGSANNQHIAIVKCLEQAQEMDANAIVNFQLVTSTNVYTETNVFNKNDKTVNSNVKYFYTGTAVKYK